MQAYYFFINSSDIVIKYDLKDWSASDQTQNHYGVHFHAL